MTKEMYTPPQIKIVEFGEEDVVVCSGNTTGSFPIEGGGTLTEGPETDWD